MDKTCTSPGSSETAADRPAGGRRVLPAVPEGTNAIRVDFDEDEPPALVFNELAMPGALVSWSWCQLKMLDELLVAVLDAGGRDDGDAEVAGAVRTAIGPVINALAFSEQRADELQRGAVPAGAPRARTKESPRRDDGGVRRQGDALG